MSENKDPVIDDSKSQDDDNVSASKEPVANVKFPKLTRKTTIILIVGASVLAVVIFIITLFVSGHMDRLLQGTVGSSPFMPTNPTHPKTPYNTNPPAVIHDTNNGNIILDTAGRLAKGRRRLIAIAILSAVAFILVAAMVAFIVYLTAFGGADVILEAFGVHSPPVVDPNHHQDPEDPHDPHDPHDPQNNTHDHGDAWLTFLRDSFGPAVSSLFARHPALLGLLIFTVVFGVFMFVVGERRGALVGPLSMALYGIYAASGHPEVIGYVVLGVFVALILARLVLGKLVKAYPEWRWPARFYNFFVGNTVCPFVEFVRWLYLVFASETRVSREQPESRLSKLLKINIPTD